MSSESIVYVVQEPPPTFDRARKRHLTKDLSSAQRYGILMPILSEDNQASLTPGPSMQDLRRKLQEFRPHKDFVCYAGGDPMSLALALLVLRDFGIKEVSVLRWDRERDTSGVRTNGGYYVPVKTPLRP